MTKVKILGVLYVHAQIHVYVQICRSNSGAGGGGSGNIMMNVFRSCRHTRPEDHFNQSTISTVHSSFLYVIISIESRTIIKSSIVSLMS
jgi:hypothetical protein